MRIVDSADGYQAGQNLPQAVAPSPYVPPTKTPTAPGAPGGPGTLKPYASPVPDAATLAALQANAKLAFDNAMSKVGRQRGDLLRQYGYTQNADGSLGVDANNPYGNYQQMLRGEADQSDAADVAARQSGFASTSGSVGRMMSDLAYRQGGEQAQLGQGLERGLSDLTDAEKGAKVDYNTNLYQGEAEATRRAIESGAFNPADYSGLNYDAYGDVSPPPPAAKAPPGAPGTTTKPPAKPKPKAARVAPSVRARAQQAAVSHLVNKVKKKGGR